jgi:hypothetical protein
MGGYETGDFVNPRTGICYLRTAFIAANYKGPSGIYIGIFIENGYTWNYLPQENIDEVDIFADLARNK